MECTVSSQSKGEGGGVTRWRTETNEQRNTVEPRGADDLGNERMSTLSPSLPPLSHPYDETAVGGHRTVFSAPLGSG